jgi:hypothetical protein
VRPDPSIEAGPFRWTAGPPPGAPVVRPAGRPLCCWQQLTSNVRRHQTSAIRPAVLATILLAACAATPDEPKPLRDLELSLALAGAWCNSDDGGRTCWAYDIFGPDGTLRACGQFPDEALPFDGTGVVSVTGNVMCYRVTAATPNFWVKPGTTYCTRILAVSRKAHTYQDMESGRTHMLTRVASEVANCTSRQE